MDRKPSDEASGNELQIPEPAHVRRESHETAFYDETESDSSGELEATELRQLRNDSTAAPISHVLSDGKPILHWYDPIRKAWRHHIRISVPHDDCRDHLANERTFLGYLRTSIAVSMMGVVLSQLWTIEHTLNPSEVLGYFILSKPLAVVLQCTALCVTLLGCVRFYRQQSAMAIGKVYTGGWEINTIGVGCLLILLMLFGVHLGIDLYKTTNPTASISKPLELQRQAT